MPIYVVSKKTELANNPHPPRLVRAPNTAQALRHVARELQVTRADQDDLVRLVSAGVAVEDARDAVEDGPEDPAS